MMKRLQKLLLTVFVVVFLHALAGAQGPLTLRCDPAQTIANFSLSATLHSVHGSFRSKQCELHFDPSTGAISGEVVFDATSGNTANDGRDKKMHKDVLESDRYPEVAFRADRIDGKIGDGVSSNLTVHGMFRIHGAEHELSIPVEAKLAGDRWTAHAQFKIPYVAWGMKNPSKMFLHVGDIVEVEFQGEGRVASQ